MSSATNNKIAAVDVAAAAAYAGQLVKCSAAQAAADVSELSRTSRSLPTGNAVYVARANLLKEKYARG